MNEREAIDCHGPTKFVDSLIGTCTKANESIIIRLREIPMLPSEMSYKPDNDYFFISLFFTNFFFLLLLICFFARFSYLGLFFGSFKGLRNFISLILLIL